MSASRPAQAMVNQVLHILQEMTEPQTRRKVGDRWIADMPWGLRQFDAVVRKVGPESRSDILSCMGELSGAGYIEPYSPRQRWVVMDVEFNYPGSNGPHQRTSPATPRYRWTPERLAMLREALHKIARRGKFGWYLHIDPVGYLASALDVDQTQLYEGLQILTTFRVIDGNRAQSGYRGRGYYPDRPPITAEDLALFYRLRRMHRRRDRS